MMSHRFNLTEYRGKAKIHRPSSVSLEGTTMAHEAATSTVGRPWARKMKANISLEKDKIKLKGQGKKIIIPLDPTKGVSW